MDGFVRVWSTVASAGDRVWVLVLGNAWILAFHRVWFLVRVNVSARIF